MTQIERAISKGQLVAYTFGQTDLAVSQSNVQLAGAIGETGQTTDGFVAPFAGEIIAIGWNLTAAKTGGSLTVGATIGGTEVAATTQTVPTVDTSGRGVVVRGTAPFAAGDVIGAEITTDASFAPITADLAVVIYALLYLENI